MPGWIDIALILCLTLPAWWERKRFARWKDDVAAGDPDARRRNYRRLVAWEWIAFAAVGGALWIRGLGPAELGLRAPGGPGAWVAAGLGAAALLLLGVQARQATRDAGLRRRIQEAIEPLAYLLPADRRDMGGWIVVSCTAGIVEELIARAYYIWALTAVLPLWAAVAASAFLFGVGHAYQGVGGMIRTGGVGVFLAVLYVLGGLSIWIPIVVHALTDLIQGWMAYRIRITAMPDAPVGVEAA